MKKEKFCKTCKQAILQGYKCDVCGKLHFCPEHRYFDGMIEYNFCDIICTKKFIDAEVKKLNPRNNIITGEDHCNEKIYR